MSKKDVFYDIGSGHGKIVIEARKQYHVRKSIGIELSKKFYNTSRKNSIKRFHIDELQNNIDFWYGNYTAFESDNSYDYDITNATIIFNSLEPDEEELEFYKTQFRGKEVKIVKKDLPLVGYKPIDVNKDDRNMWFYLMKTPLYEYRIKSKKEWSKLVLQKDDATIKEIYDHHSEQLRKRKIRKNYREESINDLKILVRKYLPDD